MNIERARAVAAVLCDAVEQLTESPAEATAAMTMSMAVLIATTAKADDSKDQLKDVVLTLFTNWLDQMWDDPLCEAARATMRTQQEARH